jgi:DNA-binding NarL/FixJ family response regulator
VCLNVLAIYTNHRIYSALDNKVSDLTYLVWYALTIRYAAKYFFRRRTAPVFERLTRRFKITDREQEIIRHLLEGRSNKQIADTLFISVQTVKAHLYNIYRKCDVNNRIEFYNLCRTL